MTNISVTSISVYSKAPAVLIKSNSGTEDESKAAESDNSNSDSKVAVTSSGNSSKSSSETAIEKLKEQIKETEKRLQQQQQQLAAAQADGGNKDVKAQRLMAIQGQISSTSAMLATQQAGLAQLEKSGSINTTA